MDDKERWKKEKEELQFLLKLALAREEEEGVLTDEDIDNIICDRLKEKDEEEVLKEYLVDKALLTCTSAKWWDFKLLYDGRIIKTEGLSDKVMSGEPTTFLRVSENDMYSDGLHHATVADTKQGLNIKPFLCNCMEPANENEEKEIVKNIEECEKNGVCQYLMDLEDEWENIALDDVSYKEFSNVDPDRGLNIGSVNAGAGQNEKKQGITMMSVLFCKHGGLIYPVRSGQSQIEMQYSIEDILDNVTAERIGNLHPMIRQSAINFICRLQTLYPGIRIAQGLRTFEEQNALYNQGRNGNAGKIVTNAKAGQSYHNYGLALDIVNIVGNDVNYDFDWQQVSDIGKECGFEWGGDWEFKDLPHFQMTFGYKEGDLMRKYNNGEAEDGYVVLE